MAKYIKIVMWVKTHNILIIKRLMYKKDASLTAFLPLFVFACRTTGNS